MAFRPNTTYTINGTTYSTFYKALIAVGSKSSGTQIKDASGNVVFTKDNNSNDFYLYQFNDYITKASALNYGTSDLISGATQATNFNKMLTWLNNYRYSKAVDGTGEMSHCRTNILYKHSDVSIADIYTWQEKLSGGYYALRSLSSSYDGKSNNAAKVTVSLSGISTNLTTANNAYFFLGMRSGSCGCEFGLQLRKVNSTYKWYAICNIDNGGGNAFENIPNTNPATVMVGSLNPAKDVTLEMIRGNGYVDMRILYNGDLWKDGAFVSDTGTNYTKRVTNSQYADGKSNEFYRMISLCPSNSTDPGVIAVYLNCSEYFAGVAFKNCYIKRGSTTYRSWPYNFSENQYAVAFNEEFIDVITSSEKVNISYKGRDNNDNLIV
ncbi:MAG: hypothetical protein J6D26_02705 [Clostridia bacterium]|nr:hypothetical protein [Clostridia bacterium]